jgi:ribonucleoside-diphosphate reductase alpha chain
MANELIQQPGGLEFRRQFTRDDINVFDMFEYDYRTSVIRNPSGEIVFEMNNVEVPKTWSQIATDIIAQKYFRKAGVPQADGSLGRETSTKQVAHRMANCWKVWNPLWLFRNRKMPRCFMITCCFQTRPAYQLSTVVQHGLV